MYSALLEFKYGERDGRPTAIICKSTKGHGGFSDFMNNHKSSITNTVLDQESDLQRQQRTEREKEFCKFFNAVASSEKHADVISVLHEHAANMGFNILIQGSDATHVTTATTSVKTQKAPERNKQINYSSAALPALEKGKSYGAHKVIESAMKVFAKDRRMMSVDSDLASTSGLQAGIGFVDKYRALNVGVAEANMMLIGEAFSILGANAWISTFCPFYDWKVLRRIAVGHQERLEVIADNGWLSEGHGIDLTMVATAADLETQSNGATHMGNDDALLLNEAAHVKIINVSCPQQLLGVMKWIVEGNKGIIYLRILRASADVIYDADFTFEFGKAYTVKHADSAQAHIVTSGRGVYEALEAAKLLEAKGISVNVIDMPSIDENTILDLYRSGKPVFIAEQNNGYLWTNFRKVLFENEASINTKQIIPINTTSRGGLHYIHSGTYTELVAHYGLNGQQLSENISNTLQSK